MKKIFSFLKSWKISLPVAIFIIFLAIIFSYDIYYPKYMSQKVVGTWRSETEGLYTVTFDSYGIVTESFKKEVVSKGKWVFTKTDSTEFELITTMDTDFHYIIKNVDSNSLVLYDTKTKQTHIFDRIE